MLQQLRNSLKPFEFVYQHDVMDCGPACLVMIARYHGKKYYIRQVRDECFLGKDGSNLLGIEEGAIKMGFETMPVKITIDELIQKAPLPCILFWDNGHYVVLYKVKKHPITNKVSFKIADPSHGKITIDQVNFEKMWLQQDKGIALFLNPTEAFHDKEIIKEKAFSFAFIYKFLKPYKREISILGLGLGVTSFFTLIFPFLTKALIDIGVESKNLNFVFIILLAQVFLFLSSTLVEIVKSWVLVYINSKINITIVSDFLNKIILLPFSFFDSRQLGDFSQRIQDHERIEEFLTSQSLMVIFSSLNFLVFFFVLTYYDFKILVIYSSLTLLAIIWSLVFLKKLEKIDYYRFNYKSESQQSVFELINGIEEVKLNNMERYRISRWKKSQIKLFKINLRALKLDQIQLMGYDFINQLKNIVVIFIAAREVILGNITLGALLSISYIIGQMNSPINQLIEFFRSWQFAKLSLERLYEVQNIENEVQNHHVLLYENNNHTTTTPKGIAVNNVSFQYSGPRSPYVLENIDFNIPKGKTTAIVGESGSGKTTLMKLLLKFYNPIEGTIKYDNDNLVDISAKDLRKNCGIVLQDGFLFSDTLERNIVTGDAEVDPKQLQKALHIANLEEFVSTLPSGLQTMVGSNGNGLSGGQRQRVFIARAVYKNPHFIFFDEATSALDAENEKIIYEHLDSFFKGKTVVKIAHRLSTVKNADQIIVLKKGHIVERGTHTELVKTKGYYFNLVKNQLELSA
ncbi:peptidase domain-containing ABC transporter [Kordia algicida OT-1]|uniref:Putative hemolysin secretion transport system ATP-binding protein n=1 Tax=Kordia algicida OT-1 TaxID=391587 RepID=A9DYH5_9FLAO|nr:peptidase domain-containing ABC transporter [Kordia algicida]EDP96133.1 putative hemolysin secretion transport system ATP-binding protein [Kordia algicida OT-1]